MALRKPERPVRAAQAEGKSPAAIARERMTEARGRMKARIAYKSRDKRLGEIDQLAGDDEDAPETVEGLDALNGAIDKLGKTKKKNKIEGAELEKWKKARARVQEIRARQADGYYYCCLVFDTGGQCQAFLDNLMARHIIGRDGDMFIDGRHVAEVFNIPLPPPEYEMTTSVALSQGKAKDMAKVPKGYKAP